MSICSNCNKDRHQLHTHHIIPRSQGGGNGPDNLIRICANCHEDLHGGPFGRSLGNTPEANAKKSSSMKLKWQEVEYKEKRHKGAVKAWESQERRKLISQKRKDWIKNNPEKYAEANRKISETKRRKAANNV